MTDVSVFDLAALEKNAAAAARLLGEVGAEGAELASQILRA